MTSIRMTNIGNWSNDVGVNSPKTNIKIMELIITTPEIVVRMAPPNLSLTDPINTLTREPTADPRKANFKRPQAVCRHFLLIISCSIHDFPKVQRGRVLYRKH